MKARKISYTPADDSQDGYANDQTGATCTLAASGPGDGMGHLVIILNNSAVDHSDNGETFVLTGTDAEGNAQTETIAGPAASPATSTSTKYFKTLTSVVPSITWVTDTYDVGWTDDAVTPCFPLNYRQKPFQVTVGLDITGTIDLTLQHCLQEIQAAAASTMKWWNHDSVVGVTADTNTNYTSPVTATRVLVNSLTTGASFDLYVNQAGA